MSSEKTTIIKQPNFDLAVMDIDSAMYKICWAQPSLSLNKKSLDAYVNGIMEATEAPQGIGFIKGLNNFRFKADINYKSNRKDNLKPEVRDRVEALYEYAEELFTTSDDGEADDYCAITVADNPDKAIVVSHIDKDLMMIPGWHYNPDKKELIHNTTEEAYRFLMQQCLSGDYTDGIEGCEPGRGGVGPKKAEKLLEGISEDRLWLMVQTIWEEKRGRPWKSAMVKCINCIFLRQSMNDLRPLTYDELDERLQWNLDTGTLYQTSQKVLSASCTMLKTLSPEDDTLEENN